MKNYMKLHHKNRKIVMDRTFAKNAEFVGSEEYNLLQQCRRDYPLYTVTRKSINKKKDQEHYRGLTYEYMKKHINKYETEENKKANLALLEEMIDISKCHSTLERICHICRETKSCFPNSLLDFLFASVFLIYKANSLCFPKLE